MVEIWSGIIDRQAIHDGTLTSVTALMPKKKSSLMSSQANSAHVPLEGIFRIQKILNLMSGRTLGNS